MKSELEQLVKLKLKDSAFYQNGDAPIDSLIKFLNSELEREEKTLLKNIESVKNRIEFIHNNNPFNPTEIEEAKEDLKKHESEYNDIECFLYELREKDKTKEELSDSLQILAIELLMSR